MAAGGYEEGDGYYMVDERQDYDIKRYREVGKALGKATYDLGPRPDLSLASLFYTHDMGQGTEFFHSDLQMDQYWLNYSLQCDGFGVKGLAYLNRADKTAFQDNANDNYTSAFRDEKFPNT